MDQSLQGLINIDRIIHEPARLIIMAILSAVEEADFLYLLNATGLTRGNLSSHLNRLEAAGYISIEKSFAGKTPRTTGRITEEGRQALEGYRQQMGSVIGND